MKESYDRNRHYATTSRCVLKLKTFHNSQLKPIERSFYNPEVTIQFSTIIILMEKTIAISNHSHDNK